MTMERVIEEAQKLLLAKRREVFHDSQKEKLEAYQQEIQHLRTAFNEMIPRINDVIKTHFELQIEGDEIQIKSRGGGFSHRAYMNTSSSNKLGIQYFKHRGGSLSDMDFILDLSDDGQYCWRTQHQPRSTQEVAEIIITKVIEMAQEYVQDRTKLSL